MRFLAVALLMFAGASSALAHGYRIGNLEIIHPVIMVPGPQSDCSCAHVKIVNHGAQIEYFLGADITAASRTHLLEVSTAKGVAMPERVAIAPGATLDLNRHGWCLFMSGIAITLEADMGAVPGILLFERQGRVEIEFMIDKATH